MALAVARVGGNTNTGSDTITSDSWTSTGGSLIVVIGHTFNQSSAFANGDVTDSKGNSYTLAAGANGGALVAGIGVWYNNGGTRGATHTVTFNPGGTGQSVNIAVIEITGADASAPFDTTTDATGSDATSPFNITAAAAISGNQIAITGCTIDTGSNTAWTNPTGYTDIKEEPNGNAFLVSGAWYKINETGTPSPGGSGSWSVANARQVFVTFKEATGGGDITKTLTPATETDSAQSLSKTQAAISKTLTPSTETDAAQALTKTQQAISKTLTPSTETDAAQALSFTQQAISVTLTPATETDAAQTLSYEVEGGDITKTLTPATETDAAQSLSYTVGTAISKTLAVTTETDAAQGLTATVGPAISKTLAVTTETDAAQTLSKTQQAISVTLTPADESDSAVRLTIQGQAVVLARLRTLLGIGS